MRHRDKASWPGGRFEGNSHVVGGVDTVAAGETRLNWRGDVFRVQSTVHVQLWRVSSQDVRHCNGVLDGDECLVVAFHAMLRLPFAQTQLYRLRRSVNCLLQIDCHEHAFIR